MNMNPAKYEYQSEFAKRYVAEGLEKGLERGHLEGRADLLIRQLTRRFGEVADTVLVRIRSASISELDAMGDRVLSASSLDEVLGER